MSLSRTSSSSRELHPVPYKPKSRWLSIRNFAGQRFSWLGVTVLSTVAIIPTTMKLAANLSVGIVRNTVGALIYRNFNLEYFKQAGLNLITLPALAGAAIIGVVGVVKPSLSGKLVRLLIFPAPSIVEGEIKKKVLTKKKIKLQDCETEFTGIDWENKLGDELLKLEDKIYPEEKLIYCKLEDEKKEVKLEAVSFCTAPVRFFNKVVKEPNIPIKTVEIPHAESLTRPLKTKYRIYFGGNGESLFTNYDQYLELKELQCHTIGFNYSGIMNSHKPESIDDLVRDGIALVYAIAKEKCWSPSDITEKLHFHGFSIGGGVALQVALHFKEQHAINIKIFIDRSFWELCYVAAQQVNKTTGIPYLLSEPICRLAFYGGGGWNLKSLEAIKKLDPHYIIYMNVTSNISVIPTRWENIKTFLGIGMDAPSPDPVIISTSELSTGIKENAKTHATLDILYRLRGEVSQCVVHRGKKSNAHTVSLTKINHYQEPVSCIQLYKNWLSEEPTEMKTEQSLDNSRKVLGIGKS